ncbi:hypothetical protein HK101_001008, partial [Irineochytrium annulatum]
MNPTLPYQVAGVTEASPLLQGQALSTELPLFPKVLGELRKENLNWKIGCWVAHFLLLFPAPIYLAFILRPKWDDVPPTVLRYLKPPVSKEEASELPLSPWQWFELKEGKVHFVFMGGHLRLPIIDQLCLVVQADPKIIDAAVWWAEHPASLRQRAEFAVRSWLLWTVLLSFFAQTLLICGFEFALANIPAWPWAMIPFSLLGGAHYTSVAAQYFIDKGLRNAPVEDRGVGEGTTMPGLDMEATLARERKRFDPCGAFP